MPQIAACTPERIESAPSDGPTVRSSRYLMPAGRAPERSVIDRSCVCCCGEPPVDDAGVLNRFFDHRHFLHLVVENHRQVVADMRRSEGVELAPALAGKNEPHRRLAIFVACSVRPSADRVPSPPKRAKSMYQLLAVSRLARADALARHQHRIRRQHAALVLQRLPARSDTARPATA